MSDQTPNVYVRFPQGSRAWVIDDVDGLKPCITCDASGEVTIGDRDFYCPDCHGNGGTEYPREHHPQVAVPVEIYYVTLSRKGSSEYNVTRVDGEGKHASCLGFRSEVDMFDTEEEASAAAEVINRGETSTRARHEFLRTRTLPPPGEPNVYIKFPPGSRVLFANTDWRPRACPTCGGKKRVTIKESEYECPDCRGRGIERNTEDHYYFGPMAAFPATVTYVTAHRGHERHCLEIDGMAEAAAEVIGDGYAARGYGEVNDVPGHFLFAEADAEEAERMIARANAYRERERANRGVEPR